MSYEITAPSGTKLVGNSAEWIVETPIVGGALTQMPEYGEVFFSNCEAALTNGTVINGGTGNNINLGQNGTTVSTGTLITPTIIECQYTG
jgi:Peptidase A4 family